MLLPTELTTLLKDFRNTLDGYSELTTFAEITLSSH